MASAAMETGSSFAISKLTPAIGAELSGVNLSGPLGDQIIDEIRQALLDHKVIFFRDQHLDQEQLLAFSRRFGARNVTCK